MRLAKNRVKRHRQLQEQKLRKLLSEVKAIKYLSESKSTQQIKAAYLAEANNLIHNIASIMLLEFIEPEMADAIKALQTIAKANMKNELGRYLYSLGSISKNAVERLAKIDVEEKGVGAFKPVRHGGYGGPKPDIAGAGAGTFSVLKEAIKEGIFDIFKSKKSEPYVPTPNKVLDPKTGKVIGTLGMEKTTAGKAADLTREREQLTDMVLKDEPKIVKFIVAYTRFFTQENFGSPAEIKSMMKSGFFGGSKLKSLVNKTFGKVPGFDTSAFVDDLVADFSDEEIAPAEIVPKNLKLSAQYGDDLLGIEDAMKELQSSLKKGVVGSALDFLGGFGVGAGPSGSRLAETKKKNFRK